MLSAIESGEAIVRTGDGRLCCFGGDGDTVGSALADFAENPFIVGTVNVDETIYMFSPKVPDRANVIEFPRHGGIRSAGFR